MKGPLDGTLNDNLGKAEGDYRRLYQLTGSGTTATHNIATVYGTREE